MLDIYKKKIFTKLILFNLVFHSPYQVRTMSIIIPVAFVVGGIFGLIKAKSVMDQNKRNTKEQQVQKRQDMSCAFEELENHMYRDRINVIAHKSNHLSLEKIYELFKNVHNYMMPKNKKSIQLQIVKKDNEDDLVSTDDEDNYRELNILEIEQEQKKLAEEQEKIYKKQQERLIHKKKETINTYFSEITQYLKKIIKEKRTTNAKKYKKYVLSSIEKEKKKIEKKTNILIPKYVIEALKFLEISHKIFYIRDKEKNEKISEIIQKIQNKNINKLDIDYLCTYVNLLTYEECKCLMEYIPNIFTIYEKKVTFFNDLFKIKYQKEIISLYKHIYYHNFIIEFVNIHKFVLPFLSENLKGETLAFNETLLLLKTEKSMTSLHIEDENPNIRLLRQLYLLKTNEYSLLGDKISKLNELSQEEKDDVIIEMLSNICKIFEMFEKTPSKFPTVLHEFIYSFYIICAFTFLIGTNVSPIH